MHQFFIYKYREKKNEFDLNWKKDTPLVSEPGSGVVVWRKKVWGYNTFFFIQYLIYLSTVIQLKK